LVERNLAKVEVESSRLFSRSSFKNGEASGFPVFLGVKLPAAGYPACCGPQGAVAKRLCTGLQIRVGRFDSGPRLQSSVLLSA
jgi:hypothetical protein